MHILLSYQKIKNWDARLGKKHFSILRKVLVLIKYLPGGARINLG